MYENSVPLPEGWKAAVDPQSGRAYYYNYSMGLTQWEPPPEATSTTKEAASMPRSSRKAGSHGEESRAGPWWGRLEAFSPRRRAEQEAGQQHAHSRDSSAAPSEPELGPPVTGRMPNTQQIAEAVAEVLLADRNAVAAAAGHLGERREKATSPGATRSPEAGELFDVILHKSATLKTLGLDIGRCKQPSSVLVAGVKEGLVSKWNSEMPLLKVERGDLLVEVNGARGYEDILKAIVVAQTLNLLILKKGAGDNFCA